MNRIARYISTMIAVTLVAIAVSSCGVKDIFSPKTEFYGGEGNATQWQLICPDPANVTKSYTLNPNQVFNTRLKGSFVYMFTALLPDNVVYGQFQARIDQLSDNAQLNGATVDWACIWGVGFAACVQPAPGETDAEAQAKFTISIVNNPAKLQLKQESMPLVVVSRNEMQQLHQLMKVNDSGAVITSSPELTTYMRQLAVNHNVTLQEVK
jgi:hypothetical protein